MATGSEDEVGIVSQITEAAIGNPALYAELIAETVLGQPVGSVSRVPDGEQAAELEVAVLTDPVRIEAIKTQLAAQMNAQGAGNFTYTDLGDRIADVTLDTIAQGASTLVLSIIDPTLALIRPQDSNGNSFIQSDTNGYLWPPIDLNFPPGTDCWWRLCQVDATYSVNMDQPNVTLTFEDRIVSWLRMVSATLTGIYNGTPDESLAGFVQQLVDGANRYLKGHPDIGGATWQPIRFVRLIADDDPNYAPPATTPASDKPTAALSRQNANKTTGGLTREQRAMIARLKGYEAELQGESSFKEVEQNPIDPPTVGEAKNQG